MHDPHGGPSLKSLVVFWLPLAFMWLVMGVELPIISAVVARLPDPILSLAAFEVAMAVAMLLQSPVIHMLSAATAVVRGVGSFSHLSVLLGRLVAALTGLHVVASIPPVFRFIALGLLNVPPEVAPAANVTLALMIPVSAGVGYRRLFQGAMIRAGMTKEVSLVMIVRLTVTVTVLVAAFLLPEGSRVPGYTVAAAAFTAGIVAGGLAAWFFFRTRVLPTLAGSETDVWSLRRMAGFYLPLALTSVIVMTSRPLLAFAIGRAHDPLTSLAAWPVVQGYLFMFTAVAHSFQEVAIAHARPERHELVPAARRLAILVGAVLVVGFLVTWTTGITSWWYGTVVGVSEQIRVRALDATILLAPLMAIGVVNSINSGMLVGRKATRLITLATLANVVVQVTMAIAVPAVVEVDGTRLAAATLVASASAQATVLVYGTRTIARRLRGVPGNPPH